MRCQAQRTSLCSLRLRFTNRGIIPGAAFLAGRSGLGASSTCCNYFNDGTAVIFVDLDECALLRSSQAYAWAPQPNADSEYTQFVRDTGFPTSET